MSNENNVIKFPVQEVAVEKELAVDVAIAEEGVREMQAAPVGIVISGGESQVVTEIPAEVLAQMEADAQAEQDTTEAPEVPVLNEEEPLNEISHKQLGQLLGQVREMMGMFEAQWNNTRQEFNLNDGYMRQLYAYNEEHRQPMPEDLTEEEQIKWDKFNGLNNITEEKVLEIFGEDHPIIGIEHTITVDRVKSVMNDFISWMSAVQEYRQIHDGYMQLLELQEEKEMDALKKYYHEETDPEKKAKMEAAINLYYDRKYLNFITEPLDEKKLNALIKAFSDEKKIQYWIERARVKLGQMKISAKFILEISQLERRFLPEEYHGQNNIFLIYFLNLVTYCDVYDKKDADRNKVACIVFGMDKFVRNQWSPELRERILGNLIEFQKQFVGKLPKKEG